MDRLAACVQGARTGHHAGNLGDHVARAPHDHRIAHAHVQARDLVGVVQGGVGHHHAGDADRRQPRDRRDRAGAPDLHLDRHDRGGLLLRRELVRQRPARRARNIAKLLLLVEPVELVDDTVDVVGQRIAARADAREVRKQSIGAAGRVHLGADRKAEPAQRRQDLRMPRRHGPAFGHSKAVRVEAQGAGRGDPRVELAQRSGSAVARIGHGPLAPVARPGIPGLEGGASHVHLATHFQ